jgi:hypothetical protein
MKTGSPLKKISFSRPTNVSVGQPLVGSVFIRLRTLSCAMICTAVCDAPGVLMIVQLYADPRDLGQALVAAGMIGVGAGVEDVAHRLGGWRQALDLGEHALGLWA